MSIGNLTKTTSALAFAIALIVMCALGWLIVRRPDAFHRRLWETGYRAANAAIADGDRDLALKYSQASLKYAKESSDIVRQALSLRQLAQLSAENDQIAAGQQLMLQAIDLLTKAADDAQGGAQKKVIEQELSVTFLQLAQSFARAGDFAQSSQFCLKAISTAQPSWDKDKDEYSGLLLFDALSLMANLQSWQGDKDAAALYAIRSLALRDLVPVSGPILQSVRRLKASLPPEPSATIASQLSPEILEASKHSEIVRWANLIQQARDAKDTGDTKRADALFKQALEICIHSDHPSMRRGTTLVLTAQDYVQEGRLTEAEQCIREANDSWERMLGQDPACVGTLASFDAFLLLKQGKLEQAAENYAKAGCIWGQTLTARDFRAAIDSYCRAANCAGQLKQNDKAAAYIREGEQIIDRRAKARAELRAELYLYISKHYPLYGDKEGSERCIQKAQRVGNEQGITAPGKANDTPKS
jgi:tetratricopeptide (TPR) repeat protein